MSKKSRKRNRRILGALAALGGAAMLANRRRNQANVELDLPKSSLGSFADARGKMTTNEAYRSNMPKNIDKKILDVSTPKTIMDSMPKRPKLNEKSIRIKPNTNKIFTIEDAKKGIKPRVGNKESIFVGQDGYLRQGENATPMTPGRFGTFKAAQEMKKGALPPQLRVPVQRTPVIDDSFFSGAIAKDGGKIVKTETGGRAVRTKKKKGIQIRGFGKARRG